MDKKSRKPVSSRFEKGIVFAAALAVAIGMSAPPAPAQQTSGDAFKNITVLKDLPADQLLGTMRYFEASLGVGCDFCHTEPRDADTEIKDTARKMIEMVQAINRNTFGGDREVSCFTCHRGQVNPPTNPTLATDEYRSWEPDSRNGSPNAPPVAGPPPAQIIDKWISTLGGMDAVNKITSRVVKASVTDSMGNRTEMEVVSKGDNALLRMGRAVIARNGNGGWFRNGNGNPRDLRNYEGAMVRMSDVLYGAKNVKTLNRLESRLDEIRGGLDVYQVRGVSNNGTPVRFWFGRETGNLLRILVLTDTAVGRNPIRIDFFDFEEEGDGVYPHRWVIRTPISFQRVRVESVEDNVAVDDSRFARPARR